MAPSARAALALLVTSLLVLPGCGRSAGGSPSKLATSIPATPRQSTAPRAAPSSSALPTATATATVTSAPPSSAVPRFDHVVVVVEENHARSEVLGSPSAPYFNLLARNGLVLTRSYAITHPSYPNYLALFAGSTFGVTDDSCPHTYGADNLGTQLRAAGFSFASYAQTMPSTGYTGCTNGEYARRHVPSLDFSTLPRSVDKPMRLFPTDYDRLPSLSFVIPDLDHDMHDGTIAQADAWLRGALGGYVTWARSHNSLLVLTWDEDDRSEGNHIPGLFVGAQVRTGRYAGRVDHYRMLRTLEASFGLRPLGHAAERTPITGVWGP